MTQTAIGVIMCISPFYIYLLNNVSLVMPTGYGWAEDVARRLEGKTDYHSTGKETEKDHHPIILEPFLQDLGPSVGRNYLFLTSKQIKKEPWLSGLQ